MDGQQHQFKKAAEAIGEKLKGGKGLEGMDASAMTGELESMTGELKSVAKEASQMASSAREAMGLTDAMVEGIYGQAYRLYNTGKYKESSQLFKLLIMLDAKEPKFALGLGACFHMMKEFESAVQVYTLCGVIDPESPLPYYHVSDCYIQMKDKISAIIALEMAITRAAEKPEYQTLRDRSQLTIENLKKEFGSKDL